MKKSTLEAARVNSGLTQEKAAEMLGISKYTLINYETGKSYPNVPMIKKIEDLYGLEYKDIFFNV